MGIETLERFGMIFIYRAFRWKRFNPTSGCRGQRIACLVMSVALACFPALAVGQIKADAEVQNAKDAGAVPDQGQAQSDVSSQGQLILVVGAPGTPEFEEGFLAWCQRWTEVAQQSALSLQTIGLSEGQGGGTDRETLKQALMSSSAEKVAPLWLVLIGHGTYARDIAKFNLRGPDVSAKELNQWLSTAQRPVVIVNCASASGPFVNRLSGPKRIVVTATRSGVEQNYARFGKYFAEAIGSPDSDLDHDGEVSVHEAFLRASSGVRLFYESESRLATEHALIDDNGDGKGTPASMFRGVRPNAKAKDGVGLDGTAALRVTLAPSGGRLPFTRQEMSERDSIERELATLRGKTDKLDEPTLDAALLPLLLRLSKIYQSAKARAETESDE